MRGCVPTNTDSNHDKSRMKRCADGTAERRPRYHVSSWVVNSSKPEGSLPFGYIFFESRS